MKKLIAMLLASVMALALFAGCTTENPNTPDDTNTPSTSTPNESEPVDSSENVDPSEDAGSTENVGNTEASAALDVLNNIYNAYPNPDNRPALGGGSGDFVNWEGPGIVPATDVDTLTGSLNVPADLTSSITDAASALNLRNANQLTAAAFVINGDTAAFAETLKEGILNTNWMCGFPEKLMVFTVSDNTVVMVYGLAGVEDPEANFLGDFAAALTAAYPDAVTVVEQDLL